jgi:hypothetical protein
MKRYMLTLSGLLLLAGCADTPMGPALQGDPPPGASFAPLGDLGSGPALAETQIIVIDFEALASSGTSVTFVASYSEDGFTLVDPDYAGNDAFGAPQSATTWFYVGPSTALVNNMAPGSDGITMLTKDDGGTFDVSSIDLGEVDPESPAPVAVPFTGTRADGSTVTTTFTTDGAAGFETFTFDGFTDLVSLSWAQQSPFHQFDNITLDPPIGDSGTGETPNDPPPDDPPPDDPPSADLPSGPVSKADCMNGGWRGFDFKNQGQCVRFVETGKDTR